MFVKLFIFLTCLIVVSKAYQQSDIISAKIETCRGCSLNRLPEVKKFVMEDAPSYERLEVKFITGAVPELIILGDADKELDRLPLSQLSRQECKDLLESKGFSKKNGKEEF